MFFTTGAISRVSRSPSRRRRSVGRWTRGRPAVSRGKRSVAVTASVLLSLGGGSKRGNATSGREPKDAVDREPVAHPDDPVACGADFGVMSDEEERLATLAIEAAEECEHVGCPPRIKVSG